MKTALVTGASSGLGKEIATILAMAGYRLVIVGRNADSLNDVKQLTDTYNQQSTEMIIADLSQKEDVMKLVEKIEQLEQLDVTVNCAGYGLFKPYDELDYDQTEQMFRVNVFQLMALSQASANKMLKQQSGHIINVASIAGKIATPKTAVYSATKSAVISYSNALRLELADSPVKVSVINPGPIQTNFFKVADNSGEYEKSVQMIMLDATKLAKESVRLLTHYKRELNRPYIMHAAHLIYTVFPTVSDFLTVKLFNKK
ncbi:SDR family NAD(P)-dependent oxidoreductase [Atopobacter phocae]|uniref:SDR family NAD(P)-dependent oxidoreductase n=1 Tax=Atopobacter phocae TaxID=136492 RepID=UPI000472E5C6|nr:SDR family oxidoreductase [Atopobacter phocae]